MVGQSAQSFDTTTGGASQALLVFKSSIIYQVSGDATLSNLLLTPLQGAIGTLAARSIAYTPQGTMFMSNTGLWLVNTQGTITPVSQNVTVPFKYAGTVTRTSASYNNNVYRISVQNTTINGSPWLEYWYHLDTNEFTGPHTCWSSVSVAYQSTFIVAIDGRVGLWRSDTRQSAASIFTEFGALLQWVYQTAAYPDLEMAVSSIAEATVDVAYNGVAQNLTVTALSGTGSTLGVALIALVQGVALWGYVVWGAFQWTATKVGFKRYSINFNQPIVSEKYAMLLQGSSALGLKLGNIWLRVELLGYTN